MNWINLNKRFPIYSKQKQVTKHILNMDTNPQPPPKKNFFANPIVQIILHALNAIITSLLNNI